MINLNNKKILLMLPSGIGDFIKDLGIINSIKKQYPQTMISVLAVDNAVAKLSKFNQNISEVIVLKIKNFSFFGYLAYFSFNFWRDLAKIAKRNFDVAICVTINPLRKAILSLLKVDKKFVVDSPVSDIKKEYQILDILGINNYSKSLFLKINPEKLEIREEISKSILTSKKNIIINMFCADSPDSIRDWNKWRELAESLNVDYNIILVGKVNFDYKKKYPIDYDKVVDLINKTSVNELLYLTKKSDLIITVDSFMFHLAYAVGTPVVGLFGPVDPKDRILKSIIDKGGVFFIYKKVACSPCMKYKHRKECSAINKKICMKISVEEVMENINKAIKNL